MPKPDMEATCRDCDHVWEADEPLGPACPECGSERTALDYMIVYLTPLGDSGEYGTDFVYGKDSSFRVNQDDSLSFEEVEFRLTGNSNPEPELAGKGRQKGSWIKKQRRSARPKTWADIYPPP